MAEAKEFGRSILACLMRVDNERQARAVDGEFSARVLAIKRFQQQRFAQTYSDLLASERYKDASRFFLDELYGPADFTDRDRQFERVVPKLVRVFPAEVLMTLVNLAELHAETEQLDSAMGRALLAPTCDSVDYIRAWQKVGQPMARDRQLSRVLSIGEALGQFTTHPWLVKLLRLMRRPAEVAGLGHLQRFLESGMNAFCSMKGADEFLSVIERRERRLLESLFQCELDKGCRDAESSRLAELALRGSESTG